MCLILSLLCLTVCADKAMAQPEPGNALWRSLIVPGWGHHYADRDNWRRGQFHLAADVVLIAGWIGLNTRSNRLEDQSITLANLRAGVDLDNKDRSFRLIIGDFDDLKAYNDHQLRSRNWNRLIDDIPDNRWDWSSSEDRRRYRQLRADSDNVRQQIPAVISLMVVNRVVSGISSYLHARNLYELPEVRLEPVDAGSVRGLKTTVRFQF